MPWEFQLKAKQGLKWFRKPNTRKRTLNHCGKFLSAAKRTVRYFVLSAHTWLPRMTAPTLWYRISNSLEHCDKVRLKNQTHRMPYGILKSIVTLFSKNCSAGRLTGTYGKVPWGQLLVGDKPITLHVPVRWFGYLEKSNRPACGGQVFLKPVRAKCS